MNAKTTSAKAIFVCQECGHVSPKWLGRCPACLVEEIRTAKPPARKAEAAVPPRRLAEVRSDAAQRLSTHLAELDTVLGGGLVPGSLVLVGGDPGIGKSTLLLQAAFQVAARGTRVLYVSGEESPAQIKLRADRLGSAPQELFLLCETGLDAILAAARELSPAVLLVDSIQTLAHPEIASAPGSVAQVRECGAALLAVAKDQGPAVVLVGHVTKEGVLAGPRILEHMVDTVIYFEGDRHHDFRILRAVKNRFGSTNEVGLFEMGSRGLTEVRDPSRLFLQERRAGSSGSAVTVSLEGSRPLVVEIQALVAPSYFGMPQRRVSGLDYNRSCLLLAVLEKRGGLALGTQDVFLSVVGGLNVLEPAVDLGLILAVASSLRDQPLDSDLVVLGEVGLGGEIRTVSQPERRLQEAEHMGFKRCLLPRANRPRHAPAAMEWIEVDGIQDALAQALTGHNPRR